MVEISTSILSVDSEKSMKTFYDLEIAHTDYFHIDVMDGKFVEADTTAKMEKYSEYLNHITLIPLDVHLMVEDVERYVNIYKNIHPEYITFHYEISDSIHRIINIIKGNNIKVGLAIKPNTDISALLSYMDKLDLILVMSVEPGKGGQKYLLKSTDRINELYEIRKKYHYNFKIEVDGGINKETISNVQKADMVVVGSYITNSSNYEERINTIMER